MLSAQVLDLNWNGNAKRYLHRRFRCACANGKLRAFAYIDFGHDGFTEQLEVTSVRIFCTDNLGHQMHAACACKIATIYFLQQYNALSMQKQNDQKKVQHGTKDYLLFSLSTISVLLLPLLRHAMMPTNFASVSVDIYMRTAVCFCSFRHLMQ